MEESNSLARVPLFASLEPDQLAGKLIKLTTCNYRQAEIIFDKDAPGSVLHIVDSGRGKIEASSPEGEEVIPAILSTGDPLGQLPSWMKTIALLKQWLWCPTRCL
jgi:CRP-like cAMP-binding protein